ncbi:FAD-binding oxidoreductase [Amylibacter sp. SFDW26]|uniref:NAD(P)/FAD-dependent oxidoreductase n=1 Tax=Amylibacter sp. SFDW26 TaxID=2652722 RepID=UPI0012618B4D|nr:FAD-binding oxidoreductase [Amylibacter sp. SFDW26]KAB7615323.1 FAD-binding oxidoreductase [Amylibacter sp. SFDW26]
MKKHIAVIGRGLIGSAAARHLALAGHQITLIGPAEPVDKANHDGVFASHYDEGRITRALDPTLFWSDATVASIARYADIEMESGMPFFTQSGAMIAGPMESSFIKGVASVRDERNITSDRYSEAVLAEAFPYFSFETGTQAFYEPTMAGHISPRRLVEAQTICAQKTGAVVVDAIALAITEQSSNVLVSTTRGEVEADQVLVAAGGFANMVLPTAVPIQAYARTVTFFELSAKEVERLKPMPSLVLCLKDGRDPYILPPIKYPNGKTYLKIGGDPTDVALNNVDEMKTWFKSGGTQAVADHLTGIVQDFIPDFDFKSRHHEACMTTFTADDLPLISRQSDRLTVAVAGCGRGAKCSDELGRIGAELACISEL